MDHNFLAGFMTGRAIMIMLWLVGWLGRPSAWVDRHLTRLLNLIIDKLIGEE
jgi:hypothetical protein